MAKSKSKQSKPVGTITMSVQLIKTQIEQPSFWSTQPSRLILDTTSGGIIEEQIETTSKVHPIDTSISKLLQMGSPQVVLPILFERWRRVANQILPADPSAQLTGTQHTAKQIAELLSEIETTLGDLSKSELCLIVLQAMDLGGAITRAGLWPQARQRQQRKASLLGNQTKTTNKHKKQDLIRQIASKGPQSKDSKKVKYVKDHWPGPISTTTIQRALGIKK
jgi:hypothetical protein